MGVQPVVIDNVDTLSPPQASVWNPEDPQLVAAARVLADGAGAHQPYGFSGIRSIGGFRLEDAEGVAFVAAPPHTDPDFARWFVMLTLKAREGVLLHTAPTSEEEADPVSQLSVPLVPAQMLVFDAHQLHWVDTPAGVEWETECATQSFSNYLAREFEPEMCLMLSTECEDYPDRAQAEALMVDYLKRAVPGVWATAQQPAPPARKFKP